MSTLIPSASACHAVQMPPIEKDDRLNLSVRTGSASTLYHSFVFTYGGLTIGLELDDKISIRDIETTFASKVTTNKLKRLEKYLSGEIFYLDLISKAWARVSIPENAPKPKPRLFHELATGKNCLYLFGGLTLAENTGDDEKCELVPCNDFWEFNLLKKSWVLLHDGLNWQADPRVPSPRFSHKMTTISHLSFANRKDHSGLMIAGGHDQNSNALYDNCVFDLVDRTYVNAGPPLSFPPVVVNGKPVSYFKTTNLETSISINYLTSVIVNFKEDVEYSRRDHGLTMAAEKIARVREEALFFYVPTLTSNMDEVLSPLLTAKIGKSVKQPKLAPLHRKQNLRSKSATDSLLRRTVPYNLRYPTGGVFGQNIVIIGFLPNDYDISIFIYNKPTGKWSRLNVFCHHDYGSHRFWGGFVWTSHHKVVLLGNYVTSRTTSSVRYFSSLITVSLPVTNLLASMEMLSHNKLLMNANKNDTETSSVSDVDTTTSDEISSSSLLQISETDDLSEHPLHGQQSDHSNKNESQRSPPQNAATFNDYVHYAAPKVKFTKVRSVFPPAAITLGRNALDRYGNSISDFELISLNGDRIPVCMSILMARWGKFFIDLLAKAYVKAVDQFEHNEIEVESHNMTRSSKSSGSSSGSRGKMTRFSSNDSLNSCSSESKDNIVLLVGSPKSAQKEVPQFRLPFQEKHSSQTSFSKDIGSIDPHNQSPDRRNSLGSNLSDTSILNFHLREIPAQLPLPQEPIPDVPATPISYRSSSRKNSTDVLSPRASLLHTLSVLRNLPARSPRGSPHQSPRGSVSARNASMEDLLLLAMSMDFGKVSKTTNNSLDDISKDMPTSEHQSGSREHDEQYQSLLDFPESDWNSYTMEPSLIPRKLYVPFSTNSLKAFAEYLYTGQVGNRWLFRPCALDCLWMSRFYKVQLLYDLLCEVLYGIIGRKEVTVIREGKKYRKKFDELFEKTRSPMKSTFKFPLDEYEGFLDTVDDGYMDIALLRKSSNVNKSSTSSRSGKREVIEPRDILPVEKDGSVNSVATDESTSASDEDAAPLHFLDHGKKNSLPSIPFKSFPDKNVSDSVNASSCFTEKERDDENENLTGITLENLVSIDAPEPSDYVIDLIHEVASICSDVKLMLRSMNARQMSLALAQTKKDYIALEKRVQEETSNEDSTRREDRYFDHDAQDTSNEEGSKQSLTEIKRPVNSSAISNLRLTPVKEHLFSVDLNRKFDKQIAHLIRQDEKIKSKAAKEERSRRQTLERDEKKRSDVAPLVRPSLSHAESVSEKEINTGRKFIIDGMRTQTYNHADSEKASVPENSRHKFFGRLGRMTKHGKNEENHKTQESPQLLRTESLTSMVSGGSKKSSHSKLSAHSVGGLLGLRKK
ncbi:hypothetical protein METBIDRAFT_77969 [Metschnikowia bicuspidata var. bicuspidata NRRL YB-4993]|uniref:Galactose oxidase n=1 Tax=Metschnikowia bicuspidata var. bicuspidata NRRL YB-4993 TaxID=869754 RepID=A0A1A0HF26_9ASCO|nr:hypothetical protein METBIDRAFT_77969 [Metschnikowia bicuspidata var. bicuspidata NRRL YB-4993]OBA22606.1 hypothetical protein METBIDRAFT_77969 [Metschnikowia bicuspidata var. bicuspidata NRRL YB-4993]